MIPQRIVNWSCLISLLLLFGYAGWGAYWRLKLEQFGMFQGDKPVFVRHTHLSTEEEAACSEAYSWEQWFNDSNILVLPVLMTTTLITGIMCLTKKHASL